MKTKFDDLFPNTKELDMPDPSIMKGNIYHKCVHCGDLTNWIDLDFMGAVCSVECQREETNLYFQLLKVADKNGYFETTSRRSDTDEDRTIHDEGQSDRSI